MSTTTQPPKPKRRWCQFSLRTLMIVMTLFTVGVGWVQFRRQRAQENWRRRDEDDEVGRYQAAMRGVQDTFGHSYTAIGEVDKDLLKIEELSGYVLAHYAYDEPTWLEQLFDDPGVPNGKIWITVGGEPKFADTGLEHLKGFTQLTDLQLGATSVTDAGLEHLRGFTNLKYLDLSETQVTDAGLEHLKGLTTLQYLDLANTKVTDASVEHVKAMANLKNLDLTGTKVTDEGVKRFDQALPNCRVWYGSRQFILH